MNKKLKRIPHLDKKQEEVKAKQKGFEEILETIKPYLDKKENTEPAKPEVWQEDTSKQEGWVDWERG